MEIHGNKTERQVQSDEEGLSCFSFTRVVYVRANMKVKEA